MKGYTTHCFLITTKSNLHAGSGDADFGAIDKKVQRDIITQYPCIHASSIKGALREFIEECTDLGEIEATYIFGSKTDEKVNMSSGNYRFFEVKLLAMPFRSDHKQYQLVTNEAIIKDLTDTSKNLKSKTLKNIQSLEILQSIDKKIISDDIDSEVLVEDIIINPFTEPQTLSISKSYFNNKLCIINQKEYDELMDLPVIARNHLENGQSENLWYEEVVPRETRFYTFISVPDDEINYFDKFLTVLTNPITPIQIGGNASIGYGVCTFHLLEI